MVFVSKAINAMEGPSMRYSSHGWFRQQMRFLRGQFAQNSALPFSDILSEDVVSQALTAAGEFWINRIYSPLVTLFSQPGVERRPLLPRGCRPLDCPPNFARTKSMLRRNRCLLSGERTFARKVFLRRGLFGRSCVGRQSRSTVVMERPTGLLV